MMLQKLPSAVVLLLVHTCVLLEDLVNVCKAEVTKTKFKAAVYEHAVILPEDPNRIFSRADALQVMRKNLQVYARQAEEARKQGVHILVFPENGLYFDPLTIPRERLYSFLEFIPDPKIAHWIPCDDPTRYSDTEVQYELSCMAKRNALYIVANMGNSLPCFRTTWSSCPPDNRLLHSANVVFDPTGRLIARYHRHRRLQNEPFNRPEVPEIVTFDTPFGRWGLFSGMDILFRDVAVRAVQNHSLANMAYLTAWKDEPPMLSSIGIQSAYARRMGVNLLAANVHQSRDGLVGSGIYTPKGHAEYYYNTSSVSEGKLVVAEVDSLQRPAPEFQNTDGDLSEERSAERRLDSKFVNAFDNEYFQVSKLDQETSESPEMGDGLRKEMQGIVSDVSIEDDHVQRGNSATTDEQTAFVSSLSKDLYNFVLLERPEGTLHTCSNKFCCHLSYSLTPDSQNKDVFAFGAFDGNHTWRDNYSHQVCVLVRCADQSLRSCGLPTNQSATVFNFLAMLGNFRTDYVFPQVLLTTERNFLRLPSAGEWRFTGREIQSDFGFKHPLVTVAMLGRDYASDVIVLEETFSPPPTFIDSGSSPIGAAKDWTLCLVFATVLSGIF